MPDETRADEATDAEVEPENPGSISRWIPGLCAGDHEAAEKVWHLYQRQLNRLIRRWIPDHCRNHLESDDIAQVAFEEFFRGAKSRGFRRLLHRDDVWELLTLIARRRLRDTVIKARAAKRGVRQQSMAAIAMPNLVDHRECPPEFHVMAMELLHAIDNQSSRILWLYLDGSTKEAIALRLTCSVRTVERKLEILQARLVREARP